MLYFTSETFLNKVCKDNSEQIARMKEAVKTAINKELTDKQRKYLKMYYFDGMTMEQIALKNGVTKGIISRTIKKALDNIKNSNSVLLAAKLYGRR